MLFLVAACNKTEPQPGAAGPSGSQQPVTHAGEKKAEFTLAAVDLVKEFIADEKAATAKYKDKIVEVEGVVNTANQELHKGSFSLTGAKKTPTDIAQLLVFCNPVPSQQPRMPWLAKGQKVRVRGQLTANSLALRLLNCQFWELEPPSTPKLTAVQLTEEYAKDEAAAKEKYYDKEIIVEGTVVDLEKTKNDFFLIKLAGAKPDLRVSCTVDEREFNAVKKGQKAVVKGDCSLLRGNGDLTVNTAFLIRDK